MVTLVYQKSFALKQGIALAVILLSLCSNLPAVSGAPVSDVVRRSNEYTHYASAPVTDMIARSDELDGVDIDEELYSDATHLTSRSDEDELVAVRNVQGTSGEITDEVDDTEDLADGKEDVEEADDDEEDNVDSSLPAVKREPENSDLLSDFDGLASPEDSESIEVIERDPLIIRTMSGGKGRGNQSKQGKAGGRGKMQGKAKGKGMGKGKGKMNKEAEKKQKMNAEAAKKKKEKETKMKAEQQRKKMQEKMKKKMKGGLKTNGTATTTPIAAPLTTAVVLPPAAVEAPPPAEPAAIGSDGQNQIQDLTTENLFPGQIVDNPNAAPAPPSARRDTSSQEERSEGLAKKRGTLMAEAAY